jgi:hypothetical protein
MFAANGWRLSSGTKFKAFIPRNKKLPAELLKEASIKNMEKKGALAINKVLAKRKAEMAPEKLERSTGQQRHSDKEHREMAKNLKIDKDQTFYETIVGGLNRQEDSGKLANDNFWDTQVRVKDGFMAKAKLALPHFLDRMCAGNERSKKDHVTPLKSCLGNSQQGCEQEGGKHLHGCQL